MRSALPVYDDSDDEDEQPRPATTGKTMDEVPEFFPKVWVGCGFNIVFILSGYGSVPVLQFDSDGHALFPMHSACAEIVHRACASDTNKLTLRSYYDILRKACALFFEDGGIEWPHKHFGAMQYWAYDDWDYRDGYLKFITDPMRSVDTAMFMKNSLKPTKNLESRTSPRLKRLQGRSFIETLPKEITDQIVNYLPMSAIYSLRLASVNLAYQVPLDQRLFRERLLSGALLPHMWDLDRVSCVPPQRQSENGTVQTEQDECWEWKGLARMVADVPALVSKSPEESRLPLGLWNRLRIWQSVVDAERWLCNDQEMTS